MQRKKLAAYSSHRSPHRKRQRPQEHFRSHMDQDHQPRSTYTGSILRCCRIRYFQQPAFSIRAFYDASRSNTHCRIRYHVAIAETQLHRSTISADEISRTQPSQKRALLTEIHARQAGSFSEIITDMSAGNNKCRCCSVCTAAAMHFVRTECGHIHKGGRVP